MERLIIAVIIIAAVLFLFNHAQQGAQSGGGTRIPGATNPNSALPAGYRSTPGS